MEKRERKIFLLILLAVTLVGLVCRVIGCFWGFPLLLHPDEPATVDYAIEMLSRHSWMAASFDRPDHFEIKCDALLFALFSRIRYGVPAYEAFPQHMTAFYIVGRLLAAAFGTALIPLTAAFTMDVFRHRSFSYRGTASLFAGLGVGFLPVFLRYSTLADPDVVLTFFVVLFAWCMLRYLRDGRGKPLLLGAFLIGVCVTIKYNGAILCLPLALAVIYRALWVDKRPLDILRYGVLSVLAVICAVALIGPNLILEYRTVLENIIREARPNHLGADGLSFWGNFRFYIQDISQAAGLATIPFLVLGLWGVIRDRQRESWCLLVGALFWACISVLKLHWSRWGLPAYPFYLILVGAGLAELGEAARRRGKAAAIGAACVTALLAMNLFLFGLTETKALATPDTRNLALKEMEALGITPENTLYEGYTPFDPAGYLDQIASFVWTESGIQRKPEYAGKRYFMMSDSFYGRYRAEPQRYSEQVAVYEAIAKQYAVVYSLRPDDYHSVSPFVLKNIVYSVQYLCARNNCGGSPITVYDLQQPLGA